MKIFLKIKDQKMADYLPTCSNFSSVQFEYMDSITLTFSLIFHKLLTYSPTATSETQQLEYGQEEVNIFDKIHNIRDPLEPGISRVQQDVTSSGNPADCESYTKTEVFLIWF